MNEVEISLRRNITNCLIFMFFSEPQFLNKFVLSMSFLADL